MKVDLNKIDELNGELTIELKPEDYNSNFENAVQRYRKQAQFPGFRPGKVPASLIKKKYGKSLLAEEVNNVINQQISGYIKENNLPVLGQPLPKEGAEEGDWENPADFKFVFELGLAPEFDVKLSKREKYTWYTIKPDEKLINQQVEDYARRYGKLSEPEQSEDKDMLVVDLVELSEDGSILEGGILASTTISLEHLKNEGEKKKLIGLKADDTVEVDPKNLAEDDNDLMRMLGIEENQIPALSKKFQLKVKEIRRMMPAELNEELFSKIFGENVKTEEEFRAEIEKRIAAELEQESKRLFKKQMSEKMLDKLKLTLPDDFLKRWIKVSNEKPISDEQLEKDYPHYADNLKWQLVENKIIEGNDLKVEHEELVEHTKQTLAKHFAMYGITQSDEELTKAASNVLNDQKEARRLYDEMFEEKIVNFVKDNTKVEEKEVTFDEFIEIAKG
ncbi:trigger factor [Luteibaculum oceani]|uniref:Trigger factor n=1 Tax=Luteibaculum oceani TaxID=1294296 RepID=A0A5C6UZH3_9FLAO|nr:trigger factor [Luteibaculum oceani]TXC78792.1 trigger factor [Luteibaculum oceani]